MSINENNLKLIREISKALGELGIAGYSGRFAEAIIQIKQALVNIENICDRLERDYHEGDKVRCHILSIRTEISKAYPKYLRS